MILFCQISALRWKERPTPTGLKHKYGLRGGVLYKENEHKYFQEIYVRGFIFYGG